MKKNQFSYDDLIRRIDRPSIKSLHNRIECCIVRNTQGVEKTALALSSDTLLINENQRLRTENKKEDSLTSLYYLVFTY